MKGSTAHCTKDNEDGDDHTRWRPRFPHGLFRGRVSVLMGQHTRTNARVLMHELMQQHTQGLKQRVSCGSTHVLMHAATRDGHGARRTWRRLVAIQNGEDGCFAEYYGRDSTWTAGSARSRLRSRVAAARGRKRRGSPGKDPGGGQGKEQEHGRRVAVQGMRLSPAALLGCGENGHCVRRDSLGQERLGHGPRRPWEVGGGGARAAGGSHGGCGRWWWRGARLRRGPCQL